MDFEEFQKHAVDPGTIYQLSGRDVFLRDSVFELARSQVSEEARSFDWGTYDLEQDSESDVVGEARTLPWMSPRRWVYIRNAHLAGKELKAYLKSPRPAHGCHSGTGKEACRVAQACGHQERRELQHGRLDRKASSSPGISRLTVRRHELSSNWWVRTATG